MTPFFSWSNFWVNKRKAKDRDNLIESVCHYFGIPILAFYHLTKIDQNDLIDQYKIDKGLI